MNQPLLILTWLCLFGLSSVSFAGELDSKDLAARIDSHLSKQWDQEQIEPAPLASDAEFLRRAWLDLCGVIPPLNHGDGVSGIRDFLESTDPNKRPRLIEALLAHPRHASHFANIWKNIMLPSEANVRRFGGDGGFESWLRGQFADNRPYDELVSELLLVSGNANQVGPALYYTALELKPEELAASTSRIFLGTQIQCAQCHDHPFDHWTQKDFWSYAAFFAQLQQTRGQQVAFQVSDTREGSVKIPETEEVIEPAFLGGTPSLDNNQTTRRERLARWLVSAENPYFAKATVNRVWAILFGRGIVEPVDDFGRHNPASHPELLNELADAFVISGYDMKWLLRTITQTRAYQMSSESRAGDSDRPELFARMAVKSLTAEQLYDCLAEATRRRENAGSPQGFDQNRFLFLEKFRAGAQAATEYEAGIPQALTLMNGSQIRQATDLGQSDLLIAVNAPFFTNEKRVEVLFLSTLSRYPKPEERALFVEYVKKGGTQGNPRAALGDVLWALLNSAEFVLNH